MTNEPAKPVSMCKEPAGTESSGRPQTVTAAFGAIVLSGVAALGGAFALFGQRDWLSNEQKKANVKALSSAVSSASASAAKQSSDVPAAIASASSSAIKKYPTAAADIHHQVSQQQSGAMIMSTVLAFAMAFIAYAVFRGRHWARWGVIGFWALASFTGTFAGITYAFAIASSLPLSFRLATFVSAVALIAAVVLVNLRTSTEYFAANRPTHTAGAPARRGLFAPRPPAGTGRFGAGRPGTGAPQQPGARPKSALTSSAATRGEAYVQKQRSKKRATANAESIARGAELARSRAKASKSRRNES